MDIHKRVLRTVLATVCACSAVAGVCMAAAPGSALAACANTTGSGSSLQFEQQTLWTKNWAGCATVSYGSTSSGKGLAEFGVGSKTLLKAESFNGTKLDGFIGTDDPPTTGQLTEMEEASGSKAVTVPVVAAPVAVIFHLPTGCTITSEEVKIPNSVLNNLWLGAYATWKEFLEAIPVTFTGGASCEGAITLEVRSDSSGTSFAFKQYLCQINGSAWGSGTGLCESGDGFVTDAETWPASSKVSTEHSPKIKNEGSKEEAKAVEVTAGSVGYVNLANAQPIFGPFLENKTLFWAQLEGETSSEFAEPVKSSTKGNCPTSYTFPSMTVETEAKEGKWAKVHLAKVGQSGAYPLCTFTYDVTWEKFLVTKLEAEYGGTVPTEEVANTVKAYFTYMTGTAGVEGQKEIANFYSPLPTNVDTIAKTLATKITN